MKQKKESNILVISLTQEQRNRLKTVAKVLGEKKLQPAAEFLLRLGWIHYERLSEKTVHQLMKTENSV